MRSFSMSAVLSLVVAACLFCADAQASRRRAPQAPRAPQGPQCRVEPTPAVKTCLCSDNCVCGCNAGQTCDCQVKPVSGSGKVNGMVCEGGVCRMTAEPQYSSQSAPQTVTYSYAPSSGYSSCASGSCGQSSGSSMTSSCSSGSCSSGNCGSGGRVAILRRRR